MWNTKKKLLFLLAISAASVVFPAPNRAAGLGEAGRRGSNSGGGSEVGSPGWEVLSKRNFSSQIRLHPHVLVMVTVPWSGESRTLMKEVSRAVTNNQQLFGHLKLMVVYRNSEKILADALDATEGVELLYYHHSKPFRYRGRLRAQNMLSSVSHIMSLHHDEIPLKFLNTVEDIENFFQSTDKAVLLLEFCGWSTKLLHDMNNGTGESYFPAPSLLHYGDNQGANFTNEAGGITFGRKENQKGSEKEKLSCGVENEVSGVPWLGDFTLANDTGSQKTEGRMSKSGTTCTLDKLQQFESFFSEFNKIAREFFLPPERQRFGVISERSLLSFLGLGDLEAWMFLIHFSGFPNLSMTLEDVNDLRIALQKHHSSIIEVDRDQRNPEDAFPVNEPSIILFIDRASESQKIREESKYALEIYRQLAHQYSRQIVKDHGNVHSKISATQGFLETQKGLLGLHGHMRSKGSSTSRIVKVGDKMAFMIVKGDESLSLDNVANDNRDNPAHDILQQLLRREDSLVKTKEVKMSLLAKEIGFQLLSDDFNVEVIDLQPPHQGDPLRSISKSLIDRPENKILQHPLEANVSEHDDELADTANTAASAYRKESDVNTLRSVLEWIPEPMPSGKISLSSSGSSQESSRDNTHHLKSTGGNAEIIHSKPIEFNPLTSHAESDLYLKQGLHSDEEPREKDHVDHTDCTLNEMCQHEDAHMSSQHSVGEPSMQADVRKEKYSTGIGDTKEQKVYHHAFRGSFFFSDGGYRLLRSLTGGLDIPSVVILDPVLHQHYVLPKEKDFTFDSLVNFFDTFLNGSLSPYQLSEPVIQSPRETPQPPFVNLDYHEADSIPRVTAKTFLELVLCPKDGDSGDGTQSFIDGRYVCAWKGDVLVLFSNSWCGFCQRMELIVREVYRTFKSFKNLLSEPTNMVSIPLQDKLEDAFTHDLPSIYHMDCTLNDCDPFLRKYSKGEVYPSVLLFPGDKKDAITYEGDTSVLGIFEFLATHGSNSNILNEHKGILWNQGHKGHGSGELSNDVFPTKIHEQAPVTEDDEHRDLPLDAVEVRQENQRPVDVHPLNGYPGEGEQVVVGSVLTATDKLLNASPFDKSSILIVKADRNEGFQGLILNKHISWDIFEKLDEGLEPLKQAPLSYGGPVKMPDLPLLSLARKLINGHSKVASDIYFGDPLVTAAVIERIRTHNASAGDFWFFLGFSSWGWDQLFDELAEGSWQLSILDADSFDWPEI